MSRFGFLRRPGLIAVAAAAFSLGGCVAYPAYAPYGEYPTYPVYNTYQAPVVATPPVYGGIAIYPGWGYRYHSHGGHGGGYGGRHRGWHHGH
ncbi:MAG: hypothetical protein GC191_05855 [Azospirillum sp.]|nr:hypothetical protein [Azospirillum sp.]